MESSMNLDPEVTKKATYWSTSEDFDPDTRDEIRQLIEQENSVELTERFYRDLEFGTGGMRGIMGAGSYRMNRYNIRKATTALARYLNSQALGPLSVAIAYDSRHNSQSFAQSAAETLAAMGIKVHITKELRPVPLLSFMVRHLSCQAGICITASHNPKEYNGFKVYWGDGGQLVPPHDQGIMEAFLAIRDYHDLPTRDFDQAVAAGLIEWVGEELDQAYLTEAVQLARSSEAKDLKIVYSPLHGTGATMIPQTLRAFGFEDVTIVSEQAEPDGSFPTVPTPNPEDPRALDQALSLAKSLNAQLVLATDPDADRIGMIVREGDQWTTLNGNQLGSLLIEYCLSTRAQTETMPTHPLVIKTIVTTKLQNEIAAHWGVHCEDTLTGFKWIGQRIRQYETGERTPKRQFICGGEESYGFLAGDSVRDKDAVSACAIASEMVAHYIKQGKTLSEVLDELYMRHAIYEERLYTLSLPGKSGAERIQTIMQELRTAPPKEFAGDSVESCIDYLEQTKIDLTKNQSQPHKELPASNVLAFHLRSGSRISVRPSGTEPKIKVYTSARRSAPPSRDQLAEQKTKAAQQAKDLETKFIKLFQ